MTPRFFAAPALAPDPAFRNQGAGLKTVPLTFGGRLPLRRLAGFGSAICWLVISWLLILPARLSAVEDPPGCSFVSGGMGTTSQSGLNFELAQAHLGDTVRVFPSLGMVSNACKAINATGSVYIASGLLTNFIVDGTLPPGVLVSCPANALCQPGPYNVFITPGLVGAGVSTPGGGVPGQAKRVRAVAIASGSVLVGVENAELFEFHTASIQIVTPCLQVFATCDLQAGENCFGAGAPVHFRGYVTNCGDIALTNLTVLDDRAGALQLYAPTNGLPWTSTNRLLPGGYAVFTNSFLPTFQETLAGSAANLITATGRDITVIGGPRAAVTNVFAEGCGICARPAIVVTKTCPPVTTNSGAVVTFTGVVTNTGDITLTNVTVVTDRLLTNGGTLVASFPMLTNGEFATFSGSYFVPAGGCSMTDTLTAWGASLTGAAGATNSVVTTCALTRVPHLDLAISCPSVAPAPGQLLIFNGTLANNGEVAVTNIVIVNSQPASNSPVAVVARLEPGEAARFTGSYLVPEGVCSLTDTLTAMGLDICGTAVTASRTNTCPVADIQNPVIACSTNLVLTADPGQCSRSNVFFVVEAVDNCTVTNVRSSLVSGSTFPVGTTTVTNTAKDASGNTSSCTFTVTVTDNEQPVIVCPTNLVFIADADQCSRSNVTFIVEAVDNCGPANVVSLPASGSTFPVGVTTVTNTAMDASGNTSTCTFTVTVRDNENPVIACPTNLVLTADAGRCHRSNVTFTASATDNCGVANVLSIPASGSTFAIGTTTVTNTASDASGSVSICTFTVTVTDNENPVILCPANLVLLADAGRCSRSNVTFTVSATDNCGAANVVSTPASGSSFRIGTTTVTNTATDVSGNTSSCTFSVTVTDNKPPVIACPTNLVFTADAGQCSRSNVTFIVDAVDNCGVASVVSLPASGSTFPVGVTKVTNTAMDASGNASACTFTVTVRDNENPVIACPTNLVLTADAGRCDRSNVTFTVSAADNCGAANVVSTPASGSTFAIGTTTVTNTATDASGNVSVCTFTVMVTDNENPAIICPANLVLPADAGRCDRSNVLFTVRATDNCGAANVVSTPASGSTFPVGVTTVTNTATDGSGNSSTCTFTVTVTDNEQPVIVCPANMVFTADAGQCSRSNVAFIVDAKDNCGAVKVVNLPASGSTFPVGVTTVTNTATDTSGNSSTCMFTVTVRDNENPVIACLTNLVLTADAGRCDRSNVTFTVSAMDNCGAANVVSIPASGSMFAIGTTIVTNTATDASGNVSTCTFSVTVTDNENPAIICPSNLVLPADVGRCSRSNVTFAASATDNCGAANVVSTPASGSTFAIGTTTVTNTATDARGNTNTCTFTVTITDAQKPVITCPGNLVFATDPGRCNRTNVTYAVSATDTCGLTNLVSSPASGSTLPLGVTTVTSKASDASGNVSLCSFTVKVVDTQYPVIVCPSDLVLTADPGRCSRSNVTFTVSATDNCGVTNLVTSPASGSLFPVGVTTVTSKASDANGNVSLCSFTVTVTDPQDPVITCPSNLVLTADAGRCSRSNVTFTVAATDNCGVNLVSSPASGSTFPLGVTTVNSMATDPSGRSKQCHFTVTVVDQQPPAITCPPDIITNVAYVAEGLTNLALGTPVTSDNCAVAGVSNNAPGFFPPGTNYVLWTVRDSSGNTSSCQQRVVVVRICTGSLSATPLTNQVLCPYLPLLFRTTASSPEPITYRWKFNGQYLPGQTSNSFTLPFVTPAAAGTYTVEVHTPCASRTNSATLSLLEASFENPAVFTNNQPTIIAEYGPALPYGSVIAPQCLPGVVKKVTVKLFGFFHNFPGDVSMALVSPDGRQVKLMAGAGGGNPLFGSVDLTFSDDAPGPVPQTDEIFSGTFTPSDYEPGVALPPPANGPFSPSLAAFVGAPLNGPWSLCVFDGVPYDGGGIARWSLIFEWRDYDLRLLNPRTLTNGDFRFEIFGQAGIPTIIESSSNFLTWVPVVTNVYPTNPGVFTTPAPLGSQRFYRALQP